MTESVWPRFPVPCGPGYNNCGDELSFDVVYDSLTDTVTITASQGVFTDLDSVTFQGSVSTDTITTVAATDAFTAVINDAFATLEGPQDITQFDFFNPGASFIGTWTGTFTLVDAAPPVDAYPLIIHGYSPAVNTFVLEGARFETAERGAIYALTLRYADPNNDGRLNTSYHPPAGHPGNPLNVANNPAVTIVEWTDTRIEIIDTRFASVGASFPGDMPFVITGAALADHTSDTPPGTGYYFYEAPVLTGPFPVDGSGDTLDCSGYVDHTIANPGTLPTSFVDRMAWNPAGTKLAMTVSSVNGVLIYNFDGTTLTLGTQVDVQTDFSGGANYHADWSRDGRFLAVGGSNGSGPQLGVYDMTGATPTKLDPATGLPGTGAVRGVEWHPSRSILAIVNSQAPHVELYAVDSGSLDHVGAVDVDVSGIASDVSWDTNGDLLAVVGAFGLNVYTHDAATNNLAHVSTINSPSGPANAVAFHPEGDKLIVGSNGGNLIDLFDVAIDGTLTHISGTPIPDGSVSAVDWNGVGDGFVIAGSAAYSGLEFYTYDHSTDATVALGDPFGPGIQSTAYALRYSPGGCYLGVAITTSPYLKVYATND